MLTDTRFPTSKDLQNPILTRLASDPCRVPLLHTRILDIAGGLDMDRDGLRHAANYMGWRYATVRPWLLLAGDRGQGKSLAASWILEQEYVQRLMEWEVANRAASFPPAQESSPFPGPPGRFVTARDLTRAAPWGKEMQGWAELSGTLVLDDLDAGWEDGKESFLGKVEDILLARYNAILPTVITTNLSIKTLTQRYPRVVDRARQLGKAFELAGASMRGDKL